MSALGAVTPLARHSDEFARLEYQLQLSCRSTAVKDVNAWSISNPHISVAHERRSAGLLTVDCWVDINALGDDNPIQEVCKRGFHMPDSGEGMVFSTGDIVFDPAGPATHQYLLVSVAVGRSFVLDDAAGKRALPSPSGGGGVYDSLYLHVDDAAAGASDPSSPSYRHNYVVFDPAQVLPRFVVHFSYHPSERLTRRPVAPINLADIKARVSDALALLGPAAPAATEKMLTDIGAAYESAIVASNAADPLLEERRRAVRDTLGAIDDKLRAIQANSAAVEEALYTKLQDALFQLQEETQRKCNLLLSEELELRRQLACLDWSESFVGVLQQTLPPMSFVAAWERHLAARSGLYTSLPASTSLASRVLDEVQPDMRLVGSLEVVTERAAVAAAAGGAGAAPAAATGAGARFFGLPLAAAAAASAAAAAAATPAHVPTPAAAVAAPTPAAVLRPVASAAPAPIGTPAPLLGAETLSGAAALEAAKATVAMARAEAEAKAAASAPAKAAALPAPAAPAPAPAPAPASAAATITPAPLEERLARYSLRKEAERRRRQRGLDGVIDAGAVFAGSRIVGPNDALALYSCLPFGSGPEGLGASPPATALLWASYTSSPPSLREFAEAFLASGYSGPTLVLIRANGHVFGGYAADAWKFDDLYGGSPSSFLFSLSRDCKLPYHGRVRGPRQPNDEELRAAHEAGQAALRAQYEAAYEAAAAVTGGTPNFDEQGRLITYQYDAFGQVTPVVVPPPRPKPFVRHDALRSSSAGLQFGLRDLVLTSDLTECTSELECSFGIGLRPGSLEAKSLLAGQGVFTPEAVEIWAVVATNGGAEGGAPDMGPGVFSGPDGSAPSNYA